MIKSKAALFLFSVLISTVANAQYTGADLTISWENPNPFCNATEVCEYQPGGTVRVKKYEFVEKIKPFGNTAIYETSDQDRSGDFIYLKLTTCGEKECGIIIFDYKKLQTQEIRIQKNEIPKVTGYARVALDLEQKKALLVFKNYQYGVFDTQTGKNLSYGQINLDPKGRVVKIPPKHPYDAYVRYQLFGDHGNIGFIDENHFYVAEAGRAYDKKACLYSKIDLTNGSVVSTNSTLDWLEKNKDNYLNAEEELKRLRGNYGLCKRKDIAHKVLSEPFDWNEKSAQSDMWAGPYGSQDDSWLTPSTEYMLRLWKILPMHKENPPYNVATKLFYLPPDQRIPGMGTRYIYKKADANKFYNYIEGILATPNAIDNSILWYDDEKVVVLDDNGRLDNGSQAITYKIWKPNGHLNIHLGVMTKKETKQHQECFSAQETTNEIPIPAKICIGFNRHYKATTDLEQFSAERRNKIIDGPTTEMFPPAPNNYWFWTSELGLPPTEDYFIGLDSKKIPAEYDWYSRRTDTFRPRPSPNDPIIADRKIRTPIFNLNGKQAYFQQMQVIDIKNSKETILSSEARLFVEFIEAPKGSKTLKSFLYAPSTNQ